MNMKKSKNSETSLKGKTKNNRQQDESPGHAWIGGEGSDSDLDDDQWIDHSNLINCWYFLPIIFLS